MKRHSKFAGIIAAAIGISLLLPSFAFAQTGTGTGTARGERLNFCTAIDQLTGKVGGAISERELKYQEKRAERRIKLDERFVDRDVKRSEHRSAWDTRRDEWQVKLSERATSDAQKAAVTKFIADIDAAIALRRSAVDSAVSAFRTGVDTAVKDRQGTVDSLVTVFKTETDAALAKAKADCAAQVAPKAVREAFVLSMKAAREKLRAGVKALENRKDTLKPLADARKTAIESAVAHFKVSASKAREELRAAFPGPEKPATTTP